MFLSCLNNDGFAQLDVVFINTFRKFIGYKISNQFANGGSELKVDGVNIFSYKIVQKRPLHGFTYQGRFFK